MTPLLESMLTEIREEAAITKRVLERVPPDRLSWRPHPKSMSLGQLALHVATIPAGIAKLAQLDEFDASQANFEPPAPGDVKVAVGTTIADRPPHRSVRAELPHTALA
jgi:hypothetical protein